MKCNRIETKNICPLKITRMCAKWNVQSSSHLQCIVVLFSFLNHFIWISYHFWEFRWPLLCRQMNTNQQDTFQFTCLLKCFNLFKRIFWLNLVNILIFGISTNPTTKTTEILKTERARNSHENRLMNKSANKNRQISRIRWPFTGEASRSQKET